MIQIYEIDLEILKRLEENGLDFILKWKGDETAHIVLKKGILKYNIVCDCITIDQGGKLFDIAKSEFWKVTII